MFYDQLLFCNLLFSCVRTVISMNSKTLPNLELLIYKAQQILLNDKDFVSAFSKVCAKEKITGYFLVPDFDVEVFSQTWSNTATGFDGPNTMSGQAITDAYTTVMHECITNTYVVFFDNKPCYKVNDPNECFMNDLKNHCLKGIAEAKDAY